MSRKTVREDAPITRASKRTRVHSPIRQAVPAEASAALAAIDLGPAVKVLELGADHGLLSSAPEAPAIDEGPLTPCSDEEVAAAPVEPSRGAAEAMLRSGNSFSLPRGVPTKSSLPANAIPLNGGRPQTDVAADLHLTTNPVPSNPATSKPEAAVPAGPTFTMSVGQNLTPGLVVPPEVPRHSELATGALVSVRTPTPDLGAGTPPLLRGTHTVAPAAAAAAGPAQGPPGPQQPEHPPAAQSPIIFTGIEYVPPEIIARLQNIVRVREVSANRYALSTLPRTADWGKTLRTEKVLCVGGKPVLIWIIGRVVSLWFFDRNGDPHLRVNLGVTVHSDEERAAIGELFGRARPRDREAVAPNTVYAGRICSQREKGEYCATATAFTQVYNATTRLTAKSAMPQLSPVDLGKNDVVVVECTFTRWKRATEGKAKKSWGSFDVGFELGSIFLVHSAPADVEDREQAEAEAEIAVEL